MLSGPSRAYFARSMRQFGVFLPTISAGIGLRLKYGKDTMSARPIYPTRFVPGKKEQVTLAGKNCNKFSSYCLKELETHVPFVTY